MRFFLAFVLALGLLAGAPAFAAEDKKKSSSFFDFFSSNKKKASSSKKSRAKKKAPPKKKPRSFSKKRLLQSSQKPKKSPERLAEELDSQLANLKAVCDLESDQESALREKLKAFQKFLRYSLFSDPYMVAEYKLKFRDLLDLTETEDDSPLLSAEDFDSSYKRFLNLPETLEPESYPHSWAALLWKAFKCAEKPGEK